jgi:SDR family mycofactocin-dependent oxidoreductase
VIVAPQERSPLAIVTGGARGIGRACVQALASSGYRVVAIDAPATSSMPYSLSSSDDLAAISNQNIHPLGCDVRDSEALTNLVQQVTRQWGSAQLVVACAGVLAGSASSLELDREQAQEIFDVDYWGVINLASATIESLRRTRGSFIAISSAAGMRGLPQLGHYCAAKHAVHGFLAALAREEIPKGVRINIVAPGSTDTALLAATAEVYQLSSANEFLAQQLDPTLNTADDVAAVVAFLASDAASGINGAIVPVDRGFIG